MTAMRYRVHLLEENEMFEQTLLRGSRVGQDVQPSSSDIDVLMRGLMVVPALSSQATIPSDGPWNRLQNASFLQKHDSTIGPGKNASSSTRTPF